VIARLTEVGWSTRRIAEALGVTKRSISRHLAAARISIPA